MVDPESKRAGIEKLVKLGVIGVACAIVGPYAWMALEGAIALAAFGGAVLLAWGVAPMLATWVANKRIQMLVAVIEANPIETMQNLYAEKSQELSRQADAVRDFETEFGNVNDLVKGLEKSDPEEAVSYAEMRDKMKVGLLELKDEQTAAAEELNKFKLSVDKARRVYKVAQAMNKALESSQSAQAKVFADIKEQVSFDKVRSDLNRAFANLSSAVDRRKNAALFVAKEAPKALPAVKEVPFDLTKPATRVAINR